MKRFLQFLLGAAFCCALLTAPLVWTGCTTPATTAYKVTSGTYYTVDAAMTAWGNYVSVFHPPVEQERAVSKAYKTWQTATVAVIDTARVSQANDPTFKARLEAAVLSASAALSGLVSVLQQFGIQLIVQ